MSAYARRLQHADDAYRTYLAHVSRCHICRPGRSLCRCGGSALDRWLAAISRWKGEIVRDLDQMSEAA